jgi:hypothetical protein
MKIAISGNNANPIKALAGHPDEAPRDITGEPHGAGPRRARAQRTLRRLISFQETREQELFAPDDELLSIIGLAKSSNRDSSKRLARMRRSFDSFKQAASAVMHYLLEK